MKPLNENKDTCSPISSNCVIWQGPDIPCIKLCKGDSISDVVFKLATELCTIMEYTKVDNYTLSCLSPANCPPADFQGLIQLIIDKLCLLTDCCEDAGNPSTARVIGGCPDCTLVIAPCFRYTNQFGDLVTTMSITDYAIAIGNKVCDLVSQIATINATLVNHENRITTLENTPPPVYIPPTVIPVCVLPSTPTQMNLVLQALEQEYCALVGATGAPSDIYQAIPRQCTDPYFAGLTNWIPATANLAQSINNIWVAICDLRASIVNINANCCPGGCEGIALSMFAELQGSTLYLFPTGTVPAGFTLCAPGFTSFTISDQSGNTVTQNFNFLANLNSPGGFPVDLSLTPINLADSLTITMNPCLENTTTGSTCQYALSYFLGSQAACPAMTFTPGETSISYSGNITAPLAGNYLVELWNNAGTILLATINHAVPTPPTVITGSFTGLGSSTFYKIRVKFTPSLGGAVTYCPFEAILTLDSTCPPPTNLVATIIT